MPPGPYYVLNTFTLQRLYYSFTTTFLTNFPVQQDCIFKPPLKLLLQSPCQITVHVDLAKGLSTIKIVMIR